MERTEKPWEREGEEREENEILEEEEEEINGDLEVRERRREKGARIAIGETNGGHLKKEEKVEKVGEVEKVEEESKAQEQKSIYFDSEKGEWKCRHCNWTYKSIGPSLNTIPKHEEYCKMPAHFRTSSSLQYFFDSPNYKVAESNLHSDNNGKGSSQIPAAVEDTPTPKALQFENGSSSNSKPYSPQLTIEEGSTSNLIVDVKELDLEKVLEEQETHDLYCPNCNSCITRRVILKKRKRIAKDVKSDSRPEKLLNLGQIETINENFDEGEQTNCLFKCLSCFSFFIPTVMIRSYCVYSNTIPSDCGFDVFHLFGGNKESIGTPSMTKVEKESQRALARQTKEETKETITAQTKEEIQSFATSETREEIQRTVNNQASNLTSEANSYYWFLGLFQPGGNQRKVAQQDKVDQSFKVGKEEQQDNKRSDENQNIVHKQTTESGPVPVMPSVPGATIIDMPKHRPRECGCPGINMNNWDILKPIVYGGLVEHITSLSVVSSAASTGASTLNILLLGAANLMAGLILLIHDLSELKHAQDEADDRNEDELGRYWALLGRKGHFGLHLTVAIISYIFFGLLPPLVYGLTFRETDNTEYKLIAVAAASLVCIAILSIGKAHVRPRRTYFSTMLYYITIGVSASGLSYVAGMLLKQLVESLGLFDQGSSPAAPSPPNLIDGTNLGVPSWASF